MKISEIETNQKNVEVEAVVEEVGQVREFNKFGKAGRVASARLKDETGTIQLTLWDDQVDLLKAGDRVKVVNAYVKEWQGEKQLNTGKFGSIEVLKSE